ncbi:MAG: hypothetical protein HDR06_00715 [Lachnospiraceae bacterium]|nr:hypothetical protein [Lachnospiraceae bacterium]
MKINKIMRAEDMRCAKIQRLIDLLCPKGNNILEVLAEDGIGPFDVGKRIKVDGKNIRIKNRDYIAAELQKVTINTEGSMAIYDRNGRKLCGSIDLNVSSKNVELFCLWVRKNNVPAEVVSGTRERIFQWCVLVVGVLLVIVYKVLNIINHGG